MKVVTAGLSERFVHATERCSAPGNWGAEEHEQRVEDDSNREGGDERFAQILQRFETLRGVLKTTTDILWYPVSAIPSLPPSPQSQSYRSVCVVHRLDVEFYRSMKMISKGPLRIATRESKADSRSGLQGTWAVVGRGTTLVVGTGSWRCH